MRNVIIAICLLLCMGCSLKYNGLEQEVLRIKTIEGHISIERENVGGLVLDTIGQNGAPKIVLGKVDHSQIILPMKTCTKNYREDGTIESEVCSEEPSISIEAKVDGKGAFAGDMIGTGEASSLTSAYGDTPGDLTQVWIESIKSAIERSSISETEKTNRIKSLESLIPFLTSLTGTSAK